MQRDAAHRTGSRRRGMLHRVRAGTLAAVLVVALAGCDQGGADTDGTGAAEATTSAGAATTPPAEDDSTATSSATETATAAASTGPMDTSSWSTYSSSQYGLTVGYPPGWTVEPATRAWDRDDDAEAMDTPGSERFSAPEGDVYVTVFAVPLDPAKATTTDVRAWVDDYCEDVTAPCTGLDLRAVELCVGEQDCHPGLLVPFAHDVQAFFTGGPYGGKLVVAAVWRNDSDITVQGRYGSFTRLLEGFLSTMDVRPALTATSG